MRRVTLLLNQGLQRVKPRPYKLERSHRWQLWPALIVGTWGICRDQVQRLAEPQLKNWAKA